MEQIAAYRSSGVLPAGSQLPSIRSLAKQLAVNPGTIVKAYNELEHAGIAVSQKGKGFFVTAIEQIASRKQRENELSESCQLLVQQASQLDIPFDRLIQLIQIEIKHHDKT
ncbi:GntR family transcriptional regulator [Persicirhabdus sediminis]|nr:GntR family transcriptional regulator [Persicirhabdus sediminis]